MRLLLIALLLASADTSKEQNSTAPPQQQSTSGSPAVVSLVNNIQPYPNQQTACCHTPPWYENPEWWLCILAVPSLVYLIREVGTTQKAASAAQLSAEAANKSATALINSERAWIMADLRFRQGAGKIMYTPNALTGGQDTWMHVDIQIRNCGPTPAWILEQWVRLEFSPVILASNTEYQPPNLPYGPGIEGADRTGKFSHANYQILPIVQSDEPYIWTASLRENGIATNENGLHAYIYGVVKYRDAFSQSRETYFGYVVRNEELERIPSEVYNKHV